MDDLKDALFQMAYMLLFGIFSVSGILFAAGIVALLMGDLEGRFAVLWWISVGIVALAAVIDYFLFKYNRVSLLPPQSFLEGFSECIHLLAVIVGISLVVIGLTIYVVFVVGFAIVIGILIGQMPWDLIVLWFGAVAFSAVVCWSPPREAIHAAILRLRRFLHRSSSN